MAILDPTNAEGLKTVVKPCPSAPSIVPFTCFDWGNGGAFIKKKLAKPSRQDTMQYFLANIRGN